MIQLCGIFYLYMTIPCRYSESRALRKAFGSTRYRIFLGFLGFRDLALPDFLKMWVQIFLRRGTFIATGFSYSPKPESLGPASASVNDIFM